MFCNAGYYRSGCELVEAAYTAEDCRRKTVVVLCSYRSRKETAITIKNFETAEENLRCANLGFAEGVMTTTDVMMAQTAWLQAKTQKIEAEIEVVTAQLALIHAYGN